MHQATVLTILNLKGGVGKTHTAWLLASVAQESESPFLAVDLDTQGNLTNSFLPESDGQPGVETLFHPGADADAVSLIRKTAFSHIDLLPSRPVLFRFDTADQHLWEKTELHFSLVDPVNSLRDRYRFVVFDCPPRLSLVSFAALCASDFVIIPMEAADWGAQGIMQVTEAIEYVKRRFNSRLKLLGYLVSRFKRRRSYQQSYLKRLRQHFGNSAFDTVIPDLAEFEKSVTDRIPVTLHAPGSRESAIARELFDEVTRRIQGHKGIRRPFRTTRIQQATEVAA